MKFFLPLALVFIILNILFGALGFFVFNLLPFVIFASAIYIIIHVATQKKTTTKTDSSINTSKLLANLANYFDQYDRLHFDDETYLEPFNKDKISLETVGIFMRDEYISSLADYQMAFPSASNTFLQMVNDYTKKEKFKLAEKPVTEPKKEEKPQEKDAQYYKETINLLNNEIDNQEVTNQLTEAVLYLTQIKKIEDSFPTSKEKTTKLYHYYLPMLVDILENYKRLLINSGYHEEFQENEDRLLKTLVLINSALKTISASLCDEYYLELSADMKTLEALLKKDGYDNLTFDSLRQQEVNHNG